MSEYSDHSENCTPYGFGAKESKNASLVALNWAQQGGHDDYFFISSSYRTRWENNRGEIGFLISLSVWPLEGSKVEKWRK